MLIRTAFDIQFYLAHPSAMVAMLHLHPSMEPLVRMGNELLVERLDDGGGGGVGLEGGVRAGGEKIWAREYRDGFGNRCTRFVAPAGLLRLSGMSVVEMEAAADAEAIGAGQMPVEEMPDEVMPFLLASRYCEVDRFGAIAQDLFGWMKPGWEKAAAIRDWVHEKVRFDYMTARSTKTAMDVYTERVGVCRDYQHLAVTLSRCQNIPARYVTGYLGDIRSPYSGAGDFSAWYQVWLDGQWWTMDARHNQRRLGRVLMAVGRDAADVAITTTFGNAELRNFYVQSSEVNEDGSLVPLPLPPPLPLPLQGEMGETAAVDIPE